jgi:hypothetical protein
VGGAAAPPLKRKRRRPILIGAGLVALLAAGLAYMQQDGTTEKVAPVVQPLAASVLPDSIVAWAPESALRASPTTTAAAPVVPTTLAGAAAEKRESVTPPTASADVASRVSALVTRSGDSLAAAQVLADVTTLQARASSNEDRAGLGLAKVQALANLGKDDESCTALRSAHRLSAGTRYETAINRLLKYGPC